ncbi:MAG: hypothetical protein LUH54_02215 [Firmicutes bacterium]|nr:hypothetical protein [Bacillota bacterium]
MKKDYCVYIDGYLMPVCPDSVSVKRSGEIDEEMLIEGGYVSRFGGVSAEVLTVRLDIPDSAEYYDYIDFSPAGGFLKFLSELYGRVITVSVISVGETCQCFDITLSAWAESVTFEPSDTGVEVTLKFRAAGEDE